MHILVLTRSTLAHGFGGFQRQCMDLCEGFVKHGHKVTVITTPHPEGEKVETQSGFTVHYLTQSRPKKLSGAWFKESRNLVDEIHQNTPIDVIHSNEFAGYGILSWAKRNNVPFAVVCHGSLRTELMSFLSSADKRPRYWHWLFLTPAFLLKRCLLWEMPMRRKASSIILVSPTLERDFRVFSKGKVKVIENGIKLPERQEYASQGDKLRLLCTGRADSQKGFQQAIKATSKIDDLDLHLDIVGTGPYLEDLKRLADKLDLHDKVTFHGRVDDDELSRLYSSADIYLIPTLRHEGLPLALLEAMAHGLPTISSYIGGNMDVITHEKDGLFIAPGSLDELVAAIRRLGADEDERTTISKAARETAERRFDRDRMVLETMETLASISEQS